MRNRLVDTELEKRNIRAMAFRSAHGFEYDFSRYVDYTLEELQCMPTLCSSQADDLKVDAGRLQVWLSRCTVEDGEPFDHKVTIMAYVSNQWKEILTYPARKTP